MDNMRVVRPGQNGTKSSCNKPCATMAGHGTNKRSSGSSRSMPCNNRARRSHGEKMKIFLNIEICFCIEKLISEVRNVSSLSV